MILKIDKRKILDISVCSANQHSNLWDKIRNYSVSEAFESVSPSFQTLREECIPAVFGNNELEYWISPIKTNGTFATYVFLFDQDSIPDVWEDSVIWKKVCLNWKAIDWHIDGKMKQVKQKNIALIFEACQD